MWLINLLLSTIEALPILIMFGIENLRSYIEKELKVKIKDEEYDTIDISNIQDNIENESD